MRWNDGTKQQHQKHTEYFLVFYSIIFVHKLDIISKDYVICLQIFSAVILPNIIKIDQHLIE